MVGFVPWLVLLLSSVNMYVNAQLELMEIPNSNELCCRAKGDSKSEALLWLKNKKIFDDTSDVFRYQKNVYNCKINTDKECTSSLTNDVWKSDSSINHNFKPILDRRWENLETIGLSKVKFQTIKNITDGKNFTVTIIIKIQKGAFIFLCDGFLPSNANCYWIILDGWNRNSSVIRKCSKTTIQMYQARPPTGDCMNNEDKIGSVLMDRNDWNNFTIRNNGHMVMIENNGHEPLLKYNDTKNPFSIKYLIVASLQNSPGEWKVDGDDTTYHTGGPYRMNTFENKSDFYFGVSAGFTSALDTHIFICDNTYILNSSCHQIILDSNSINPKHSVCKLKPSVFECIENITNSNEVINSKHGWKHFTLQKVGDRLSVLQNERVIVNYTQKDIPYKNIFIGTEYSSQDIGVSKVHNYGVLTAMVSGETSLLLFHTRKEKSVCVAIFVYECTDCKLHIQLLNSTEQVIVEKSPSKKNQWEEIQLTKIWNEDGFVKLRIVLEKIQTTLNRAFIGDIRQCAGNDDVLVVKYNLNEKKNYTCVQLSSIEKSVRVSELQNHAPNFTITKNKGIITLSWNGEWENCCTARYYRVEYRGCPPGNLHLSKISEFKSSNYPRSKPIAMTLGDVVPFSKYVIELYRNDRNDVGVIGEFNTPESDFATREELPHFSFEQNGRKLIVNLSVDCTTIRGKVYYKINASCIETWCENYHQKTISKKGLLQNDQEVIRFELDQILGESEYEVFVEISRSSTYENTIQSEKKTFRSKPTSPLAVKNFEIYSKTSSSIFVRWKKPFPPSGEVERYVVEYFTGNNEMWQNKTFDGKAVCKIWDDFVCVEISELKYRVKYLVQVKAKNKYVDDLGDHSLNDSTTTIEEISEPPENLTISWDENLNLTLTWNHPNKSNGIITKFFVSIDNHIQEMQVHEEKFVYSFKIDATNFSSRSVNFSVVAHNSAGNSSQQMNYTETPPKTPIFVDNDFVRVFNKDIISLNVSKIINIDGHSEAFLLICNKDDNTEHYKEILEDILSKPKDNVGDIRLIEKLKLNTLNGTFIDVMLKNFTSVRNTNYKIIIVLKNTFSGIKRYSKYEASILNTNLKAFEKKDDNISPSYIIPVVLSCVILLLLIIGVLTARYFQIEPREFMRRTYLRFYRRAFDSPTSTSLEEENTFDYSIPIEFRTDGPYMVMKTNSTELQDPIYDLVLNYSRPVQVENLEKYVENETNNSGLIEQFEVSCATNIDLKFLNEIHLQEIDLLNLKSTKNSITTVHKKKNRYANIVAHDETRVRLSLIDGDADTDYINASYIRGYNNVEKAYIATQGPTAGTVNDFWRMIWQEKVERIVMLTNLIEAGKAKCTQYWPEEQEEIQHGSTLVRCEEETSLSPDLRQRVFSVSRGQETRMINQIHYGFITWPDHGVPDSPFKLREILILLRTHKYGETPLVVHCSAGVGRSGTLILCDIIVRMARATGRADIFRTFCELRQQRMKMVQTKEEYLHAHQVIVEVLKDFY